MSANKLYLLLMLSPASLAATLSSHFHLDISESSNWTDNAMKESREGLIFSERQNISSVGLNALYQNDWLASKALYDLESLRFSENSQPKDIVLNGSGEIMFGRESNPLGLKLTQSSATLLNKRDALALTSNKVDRSIYTIEPSLRVRITDADQLETIFAYSKVKYKNNGTEGKFLGREGNNSSAENLGITYSRGISPIDDFLISLSSGKTEFEAGLLAFYRQDKLSAEYRARLRHLSYSFVVGGSSVKEADQKAYTSPLYAFAVSYQNQRNAINLNFNQEVGDSTRGSKSYVKEKGSTSQFQIGIPGLSDGVDVVEFSSLDLAWTSTAICERCSSTLSLQSHREDFHTLSDDLVSRGASAAFTYKLTRDSNLEFLYGFTKQIYDQSAVGGSQRDLYYHFSYATKVSTGFRVDFLIDHNKRTSDESFNTYSENIIGLKLIYSL